MSKTKTKTSRTPYSFEKKALISIVYRFCKTPADRLRVVRDHNVGTISKLYNLASRIDATKPHAGSAENWSADSGYDATKDYTRLYLRDDYHNLTWDDDDPRVMREHFGKSRIEELAIFINKSESAVAYKAREMGLRNIPKYYNAKKVAPWLGLSMENLFLMEKKIGLELFPCCNFKGELKITLVSTTSLARCLLLKGLWKYMVDKCDADEIFIRDVIESVVALQKGDAIWEPSPWVSHGHISLNPYSDTCFGLFFNGNDDKMIGEDLDPRDLSPDAKITEDSWRRGENGSDNSDEEILAIQETLNEYEKEIALV